MRFHNVSALSDFLALGFSPIGLIEKVFIEKIGKKNIKQNHKSQIPMTKEYTGHNKLKMTEEKKPVFDLRSRILRFIISVIDLTRKLPNDRINAVLISQIIRSSTSIGANYEEEDGARSKKEFISTMGIVKKEAKETKYWLKVIRVSSSAKFYSNIDLVGKENEELIRIFAKIIINSNS